MPAVPPSNEDLRRASRELHLGITEADLDQYRAVVSVLLPGLDRLEELSAPYGLNSAGPDAAGPGAGRSGRRPAPQDNRLGAWYWQCSIVGTPGGALTGQRVVLKDNIALAGAPMMNGSALLDGYRPEHDATVVSRILAAGGEIVGKAVCEDLCLSAGSHTAATGPVRNPHDPARSAGGSSSGCAALVAAGDCDLAVGGDQGGSVRVPSALCGCYGLKPTYGTVPYTGAVPIDMTLDHLGPLARSTRGVAALLEAIAGSDGLDPRQRGPVVGRYTEALTGEISDLRVGVLAEGFAWPTSDPEVDDLVRRAADRFRRRGAEVGPISVPWHRDGSVIAAGILGPGLVAGVLRGNAVGTGWKGPYPLSLAQWIAEAKPTRSADLAPNVKAVALLGYYLGERYGSFHYGAAQNLVPVLTAAYDRAFEDVDLLVMPTTQTTAALLPPEDASILEKVGASFGYTANTSQFDATGHPAMSIPCGRLFGLPVGLMLVGRRGEDDVVLRAADAFEEMASSR